MITYTFIKDDILVWGPIMNIHSSTWARKNLFALLKQTIESNDPVVITGKIGDAVLISKADYDALMETLYLHSVPGLVNSLRTCDTDNPDEWINEDDLQW